MAKPFVIDSVRKTAILRFSQLSMTPQFLSDLRNYILEVRNSPENYQALILTSTNHKIFSTGLDLNYFLTHGPLGGVEQLVGIQHLCAELLKLDIPTIAGINGHAFAGGALISLSCDWRVMRNDHGFF